MNGSIIGDYEIDGEIQSTGNSIIYSGFDRETGEKVAIKMSKKLGNCPEIENECNIMSQLDNYYAMKCIKYYDSSESGINKNVLIMPKAHGSDLSIFLGYDTLKVNQVCSIMKFLLEAVNYLHSQKICHLDIKLENIFCMDDSTNPRIVLGDFGCSGVFLDDQIDKVCGTPLYWAPERYQKQKYTNKVDIWSLGVVMHLLLFNNFYNPFDDYYIDLKDYDHLKKIIESNIQAQYEYSEEIDRENLEEAIDLLKHLLDPNPITRFSAEAALRHQWFEHFLVDETKERISNIETEIGFNDQNEIEGYSPDL